MGKVEAICVSEKKGEKKTPVQAALFVAGHGIEGDAHAGDWHRQVSLLAAKDIQAAQRQGVPDLPPGSFAENLVLSGVDLGGLGLGSRLQIGADIELVITQIGKICHTHCAIFYQTGDCIMPRLGVFTRTIRGGSATAGDDAKVISVVPRAAWQAVVLTISDRCSRGEAKDSAGPAVSSLLEKGLEAHIYQTEIIPDDRDEIVSRLTHYSAGHSIDLILTVGGTGFSPRDLTPECVSEVIDRPTPGLDEAMRQASLGKTPHAMLSRSVSGIKGSTLIISVPGSERASVENLGVVLPALQHGLAKLRGDPTDCDPGRKDDLNA